MLQATVPVFSLAFSLALWPLLLTSYIAPPPYLHNSFTTLVGLSLFLLLGMPSHLKNELCFAQDEEPSCSFLRPLPHPSPGTSLPGP